MKFDPNILQQYVDQGWLECHSHNSLPLKIYNYSRECTFERKWDEITLKCRGLILDNNGNLVAKSFDKFFNFEEINPSDYPFSDKSAWLGTKEDGSLGILFNYNNQWVLSSKGSFTSDQAIKGQEILQKYNTQFLNKEYTYIFEIVYPENRIVVDYGGEEKLILLSILEKDIEKDPIVVHMAGITLGCPYVQYKNLGSISKLEQLNKIVFDLRAEDDENKEGFVIRFSPSNFRMKIKFEEYVRLHKLMTNFSNVDIWDVLRNGEDFKEILLNIPDELDDFIKETINNLKQEYKKVELTARKYYLLLLRSSISTRKDKAFWIKKNVDKQYQAIVFDMIDKTDYSKIIWKIIKPEYSKPFGRVERIEA